MKKNQGKIAISFYLLKPLAKRLKEIANREKKSQAAMVETIIENFVKE